MITILIHVLIALTSVVLATVVVFRPSLRLFVVHYGFVAATVATGSYLLVAYPTHIVQSCAVGLVYLAVATTLSVVAQVRIRKFVESSKLYS